MRMVFLKLFIFLHFHYLSELSEKMSVPIILLKPRDCSMASSSHGIFSAWLAQEPGSLVDARRSSKAQHPVLHG